MVQWLPAAVVCVLLTFSVEGSSVSCPYQDPNLAKWSELWGRSPTDSVIVIDRPVLLDVSPYKLQGINITREGKLVFTPLVEIHLRTKFIRVDGQMVIGSKKCPYFGRLNITLTGTKGHGNLTGNPKDFGEKFIGVNRGGSLQIYGIKKRSWTKLNATYNPEKGQKKTKSDLHRMALKKSGVHVYVFSPAGKLQATHHFQTFKRPSKFERRLRTIEKFSRVLRETKESHYILVAVNGQLMPNDENVNEMSPYYDIYESVERLLGSNKRSKLREFQRGGEYLLVAKKGHPSISKEDFKPKSRKPNAKGPGLHFQDPTTTLHMRVAIQHQPGNGQSLVMKISGKNIKRGQQTRLTVIHDVSSWKPGDRIVVFSTDFEWEQAEEALVQPCPNCAKNELLLDRRLKYTHWGTFLDGVDERAEVALLSRNIRIHGEMEQACPSSNKNCGKCPSEFPYCGLYETDTFGGHIIVLNGFKKAHIEGVEMYHMGQQTDLGRYPIHFHMAGNVSGKGMVVGNSIHHTFSRCVVVHATHHLLIKNNVCYDHLGHGYFVEDGGEKNNMFEGNLGGATKPSNLTHSDADPSTFWITSPLTSLKNNAAAGGMRVGFWFIFPNQPMGPSQDLHLFKWGEAKEMPITLFCNNVAHSYRRAGLFVGNSFTNDSRVTACTSQYSPNENGTLKYVVLRRFTGYKNMLQNAWIVGGAVQLDRASMADSAIQVFFNDRGFGRQMLTRSILVGATRNTGSKSSRTRRNTQKKSHRGVTFNGQLDVNRVWFNGFKGAKSGAIGFLSSNIKMEARFNNTRWGYTEQNGNKRVFAPDTKVKSKVRTATFLDMDGSVTGVPNTRLLNPTHLAGHSMSCKRKTSWNMALCSNTKDYAMVFFKFRNGFANAEQEMVTGEVTPESGRHRGGGKEGSYVVTKNGTYIIDYWHSKIREIHLYTEKGLLLESTGLDEGESLNVGLCLPSDMSFKFPEKRRRANTWSEFQNERRHVYFFNDTDRIFFVKFIGGELGDTKKDVRKYQKSTKLPLLVFTPRGVREFTADCKTAAKKYQTAGNAQKGSRGQPPRIFKLRKTDKSPPKGYGAGDTTNFNLLDTE